MRLATGTDCLAMDVSRIPGENSPSHQQSCKLPGYGVLGCLDTRSSSLGRLKAFTVKAFTGCKAHPKGLYFPRKHRQHVVSGN